MPRCGIARMQRGENASVADNNRQLRCRAPGRWRVIPRWTVMERYVIRQAAAYERGAFLSRRGGRYVRTREKNPPTKIDVAFLYYSCCNVLRQSSDSAVEKFVPSLETRDDAWCVGERESEREGGAETTSLRSRGKYGACDAWISPRRGRNIKERRVVNSNGQIRPLTKWQKSYQSFGTLFVGRKTGSCMRNRVAAFAA